MSLWDDTKLQAVRLVDEIIATQDNLDLETLRESMDLEMDDLLELMDRIQEEWEKIKQKQFDIQEKDAMVKE